MFRLGFRTPIFVRNQCRQNRSNTPNSPLPIFPSHCPRSSQRKNIPFILLGNDITFTTPFSARFLPFPQRNWPFPESPAVNLSSYVCRIKRKNSSWVPATSTAESNSPSGLTRIWVSPAGHLWALLLPFLISGPDLGVWPDC